MAKSRHTSEQARDWLREQAKGDGFLSSREKIADTLGWKKTTAHAWLCALAEQGLITLENLGRKGTLIKWNDRPNEAKEAQRQPVGTFGTMAATVQARPGKTMYLKAMNDLKAFADRSDDRSEDRSEKSVVVSFPTPAPERLERIVQPAPERSEPVETPPPPAPAAVQPRRWWQRNWPLTIISAIALGVSLTQGALHAAERAHGEPVAFVLLGLAALTIGLAAPICMTAAWRRTDPVARAMCLALGLVAFVANAAGALGYTGARANTTAAMGEASTEARARAKADLARLRERQKQLDKDALAARDGPECRKRPIQCQARSNKIAKEAAALTPQIQAAEQALDSREVRAAADPASAALADLVGLKEGPVRQGFIVVWAVFIEALAAFGFGLAERRG